MWDIKTGSKKTSFRKIINIKRVRLDLSLQMNFHTVIKEDKHNSNYPKTTF